MASKYIIIKRAKAMESTTAEKETPHLSAKRTVPMIKGLITKLLSLLSLPKIKIATLRMIPFKKRSM